jgi:hypothetical protein
MNDTSGIRTTTRCRNCGHDLSSLLEAKFCPACGQETDTSPPTLREFINHFFGNYIAVKGGFPQTLWRLISRPGALTVDYLQGRKRRYMLPFRLYLTISVISFLAFGLLTAYGMRQMETKLTPDDFASGNVISFGDNAKATFEDGKIKCNGLPDVLCDRIKAKFSTKESLRNLAMTLPERMIRYWAYAMFALVPTFAGLLKLVYVRRRMTYGSHVVFALHLHAFWLLAILVSFAHEWVNVITSFAIPIYAVLAMRHVYGGGWMKTLLKAAFLSLAYVVVATIAVGVVAAIALLI